MRYPENPTQLPDDFTRVQNSYIQKVILAIAGLLLFFILYFAMIIGLGKLAYWQFLEFKKVEGDVFNLAFAVGAFMLFLFTLKFIFRWNRHKDKISVVVKPKDEPELYDFIHRIAKDAKAPKPNKIIIDHDVNASVSFHSTFLSLFFPGKKNLRIGLALVNGLNLTEFKAVMAHEFGHFSQSSMRVGSYVYMTNTIIQNMIFERDYWDRALEIWRSIDIRLSFIAWIITPFVWLIRQLLFLLYKLLNILHASLSREMEFHADKVAVSLTGSEAIVSALWKLEKAYESWNKTLSYTATASQQKVHTSNLFVHQQETLDAVQDDIDKSIHERDTDDAGHPIIFKEEETFSSLNMYASHPSNKDREQNAKTPFIEGVWDVSSPWKLFKNPKQIQRTITKNLYVYAMGLKEEEYIPALDKMTSFIAEEKQTEQIFGKEYLGNFEQRYFTVPNAEELQQENLFFNLDTLQIHEKFTSLIKDQLVTLMEPAKRFEENFKKLVDISTGVVKAKVFEYEGTVYKKKHFQLAADRIENEKLTYFKGSFKEWDKELFHLSYAATPLEDRDKQLDRFKLIELLQQNLKSFVTKNVSIITEYQNLVDAGDVTDGDITSYVVRTNNIRNIFEASQKHIEAAPFVSLPNIETKEELLRILVTSHTITPINSNSFKNGDFNTFLNTIDSIIFHYNRIIFKLTADVLAPLERISKEATT
ncbi:M48 family metalloprotease [Dokdonia ponticola]|uniref:M48 family metalloprotease n=1 Tax=Dokdonia ponticola TaxID=2041041 RepID=A0ABV9I146_9FLAO